MQMPSTESSRGTLPLSQSSILLSPSLLVISMRSVGLWDRRHMQKCRYPNAFHRVNDFYYYTEKWMCGGAVCRDLAPGWPPMSRVIFPLCPVTHSVAINT